MHYTFDSIDQKITSKPVTHCLYAQEPWTLGSDQQDENFAANHVSVAKREPLILDADQYRSLTTIVSLLGMLIKFSTYLYSWDTGLLSW